MSLVIALIGAQALYLMYGWLAAAIIASWLSNRKGYGEKLGLASGLILHLVGVVIWLIVPAKADSRWKLQGVFGRGGPTVAEARAHRQDDGPSAPGESGSSS